MKKSNKKNRIFINQAAMRNTKGFWLSHKVV